MFDTVMLKATGITIDERKFEGLNANNLKKRASVEIETGEVIRSYEVFNIEEIPYIKYYSNSQVLYVQASIPKLLFGENVEMVKQPYIKQFFDTLQASLFTKFGVRIEHAAWQAVRIDVCYNFEVENVSDYIRQLANLRMPYKNTVLYNHDQTVVFKNNSSQVKFYDKFKESQNVKANSILRMEIQVSKDEMKKHSPLRQAIELLTKDFFIVQTEKVLSKINIKDEIEAGAITSGWLETQNIIKLERCIGFREILQAVGETTVKELYKQTYYNRIKLMEEIPLPNPKKLSLTIDYSQFN